MIERKSLDPAQWSARAEAVGLGEDELMALFADGARVHMILRDPRERKLNHFCIEAVDGRYPSVGRHHAPAIRLERAIRDLHGLEPEGLPDQRRWLDHNAWGIAAPLSQTPRAAAERPDYAFLPVEGDGVHQIPVGPVHAGIIEPGHFRFSANGETVVRLDQRLGYVHKGTESLMAGATLEKASMLAGRVSGDSTVAYQFAFARAVEMALGISAPHRATHLRALMAELERIANHLGDFGAICNDATFVLIHAHAAVLREEILQAADECFGHRLMRDCIVPSGVARDLSSEGAKLLRMLVERIRPRFRELFAIYDDTASLLERTVSTGFVSNELVTRFSAGGHVGRASGRNFDARRDLAYAPYEQLNFDVPVLTAGDVDARLRIRTSEIEQSFDLILQLLDTMPAGECLRKYPEPKASEGFAFVESFRGDVMVWLRIGGDGKVARCHPRDPSWFQWPLLEAAVEGNIVADFPLCNKSFNCSYSGHDL